MSPLTPHVGRRGTWAEVRRVELAMRGLAPLLGTQSLWARSWLVSLRLMLLRGLTVLAAFGCLCGF